MEASTRRERRAAALALALLVLWGCGDDGGTARSPATAPGPAGVAPAPARSAASFTLVNGSAAGFTRPAGLAVAKDGKTLYFTASRLADDEPGVFALDLGNQAVTPVHVGEPFVEPRALAASPDGAVLLVVDPAAEVNGQVGTVFRLPLAAPAAPVPILPVGQLELPAGIAIDRIGARAYVTGLAEDDRPALLTMTLDGAAPRLLCAGAPLEDPVDVLVAADQQSVLVLDTTAGTGASPVVFRVPVQGGAPAPITSTVPARGVAGLAADPFGMELYLAGAAPESGFAGVLGVALSGEVRTVVSGAPHEEPSGLVQSPVSAGVLYAADARTDTIVAVMR